MTKDTVTPINYQAGDFITVQDWKGIPDRSYIDDVLEVLAVDGDLIQCIIIFRHPKDEVLLSTKKCTLRRVSKEFAEACRKPPLKEN